jgi:hypothetical protein
MPDRAIVGNTNLSALKNTFTPSYDGVATWSSLCPGKQADQNDGKKLRQSAHPLPEVEGSSGHEQVDGVAEHSFQEIPRHAVIMFDVSDHWFNPGSSPKAFSRLAALGGCVPLFRSARRQYFRVAHPGATPIAPVADGHLGTDSRDLPCLLQYFGQRIAIIVPGTSEIGHPIQ